MILPIEKQVASLESSKKLKEMGFRQDTLFYWEKSSEDIWTIFMSNTGDAHMQEWCAAPTAAELGEVLNKYAECYVTRWYKNGITVEPQRKYRRFKISKTEINRRVKQNEIALKMLNDMPKTEAEARALMLIYLIEKGLIKL